MGITEERLSEIFKRYYVMLLLRAHETLENMHDAQDIVSDCFLQLWINKDRYTNENAASILFKSVRNRCISEIIRRRRYRDRIEGYSYVTEGFVEQFDRTIVNSDDMSKIYEHLHMLTDKARRVFELSYFEGKSCKEVADLMGVSVTTVTTWRWRIMKRIKKMI